MSKTLGRGLSALFGDDDNVPTKDFSRNLSSFPILSLSLDHISPNAKQPRQVFQEESLKDLCESIKAQGVLQPVLVRQKGAGYELIAGERRWRASMLAGLETIPAHVMDCSDEEALTLGLIENLQREDLNPLEEAESLQVLMEKFGKTQEEIGQLISKSRFYVSNSLRLLSLPESAKQMMKEGKMHVSEWRHICKFSFILL
jgi:ParB family chromosome partitioning protein